MFRRLLITFLGFSLSAFSQQRIVGKVICRDTGAPIRDAHVIFEDTGVVTDATGRFVIQSDVLHEPFFLKINHIQYESAEYGVSSDTGEVCIQLTQRVLQGQAISVSAEPAFELKSSVSAAVISKKDIEYQIPTVVADVLTHEVGITTKSHYQSPLVMRGLSGQRLLILKNGNRRFGSYPAGFMSHTVNVYDLEKIEIQKGPASVAYGSGAIAGVVNLIDKSPFRKAGMNARVTSSYASNNAEKALLFCGGWSNGTWAAKGAYRSRSAGAYHFSNAEPALNSNYSDTDLFAVVGLRKNNHQLEFHFERHNGGPWGKPVGFSGTEFLTVKTVSERNTHYAINWSYEPAVWFETIDFHAYYASEYRQLNQLYFNAATHDSSYEEVTYFTHSNYGFRVVPVIQLSADSQLKSGIEFYHFQLSSPTDVRDYFEDLYFENRISQNARSLSMGVFSEIDIRATSRLWLRSGIRYDAAQTFEGDVFSQLQEEERKATAGAVSATLSARYRTGDWSHVKLNLARAFRMPMPYEMFSQHYTSNGVLYGNPELEPETSWNADLVYLYHPPGFQIEVSPYYWLLDQMITKEIISGLPGLNYQYTNIGLACIWGSELNIKADKSQILNQRDALHFKIGAAFAHGTDLTENKDEPLDHIPPFHVLSEMGYQLPYSDKAMFRLKLNARYYGFQNRLPETAVQTSDYVLLSAQFSVQMLQTKGRPVFQLVVNNMLDAHYYAFQSLVLGKGRDVRMQMSLSIE